MFELPGLPMISPYFIDALGLPRLGLHFEQDILESSRSSLMESFCRDVERIHATDYSHQEMAMPWEIGERIVREQKERLEKEGELRWFLAEKLAREYLEASSNYARDLPEEMPIRYPFHQPQPFSLPASADTIYTLGGGIDLQPIEERRIEHELKMKEVAEIYQPLRNIELSRNIIDLNPEKDSGTPPFYFPSEVQSLEIKERFDMSHGEPHINIDYVLGTRDGDIQLPPSIGMKHKIGIGFSKENLVDGSSNIRIRDFIDDDSQTKISDF